MLVELGGVRAEHIANCLTDVAANNVILSTVPEDCTRNVERLKFLDAAFKLLNALINLISGGKLSRLDDRCWRLLSRRHATYGMW